MVEKTPEFDLDSKNPSDSAGWSQHGWFYISVRVSLFLWVALLNLVTISSTWARIIDVMDNESGSRLFGFVGAGATLGQLVGSLFAVGFAWLGPYLLLIAAFLMELAAQSSKGINQHIEKNSEELSSLRTSVTGEHTESNEQSTPEMVFGSKLLSTVRSQPLMMLDGMHLIISSTYLLHVSLFLWLGAVVSSIFYFQKVTIIAMTIGSAIGRRKIFAQINSFIAIFILIGQLSLTGRILTLAGITAAICSSPFVSSVNMIAIALWPTWLMVAISETLRKVVTYVVTRPGRELLFTVVSADEKYKAKICIDIIVQRFGDATAAGIYKLLFGNLTRMTSSVSLYTLPLCLLWTATAYYLGRRQVQLARTHDVSARSFSEGVED